MKTYRHISGIVVSNKGRLKHWYISDDGQMIPAWIVEVSAEWTLIKEVSYDDNLRDIIDSLSVLNKNSLLLIREALNIMLRDL